MVRNRIKLICKICGSEFEVKLSEKKCHATCSKPCSLKYRSLNAKGRKVTWGDKIRASRIKNGKPRDLSYITEEYKEKQRQIAIANGLGRDRKGKTLTLEHRQKMAQAHRGHSRGGWKLSDKTRAEMSERFKGSKGSGWKGGITKENALLRASSKYVEWRSKVFQRDNFTCQFCGRRGVELHADHIKPFAFYKDLRFDISNGRTLCIPCHKETPTFAGKIKRMKAVHDITIRET